MKEGSGVNLSAIVRPSPWRTAGAVVVYGVLLHWCYATLISPAFDYRGITYRTPSIVAYFAAFVMAGALSAILPRHLRRPSDFVIWLMFIMVVVPSMLVPHYADVCSQAQAMQISVLTGALFALAVLAVSRIPTPSLRINVSAKLYWGAIAVFTIGAYAYVQYHVGLQLKLVALSDVYALRFKYREVVAEGSAPFLGYLIRWQSHVINPLIIARGVFGSKPLLVVAGAVGQLVLFPVTGYKMTLLSIPLLIVVALALRHRVPRPSAMFELIVVGVFVAIVADKVLGSLFLTTFFVDRLLLTPGVLTAAYVDVFDGRPKALWGDGLLARFTDYPYSTAPPYIVGAEFHGEPDTYANANIFADGYANLGYTGMLIEVVVFALILFALNSFGRHVPFGVTALVLLMPTLATANSGILTSLLTNGYALAIIVLLFVPSDGWSAPRDDSSRRWRASRLASLAGRVTSSIGKKGS